MKALTLLSAALSFALFPTTVSAKPTLQKRAVCGQRGSDFLNPVLSVDARKDNYAACSQACLANLACNAFAFGLFSCTLYKNPVSGIFVPVSLFGNTFYDRSCLVPTPSSPPATTTARPTTTSAPAVIGGGGGGSPGIGGVLSSVLAPIASLTALGGVTTILAAPIATGTSTCIVSALLAQLPAGGTCGTLTGGTATRELAISTATSLNDCAVECAVNLGCLSFGWFGDSRLPVCALYGAPVAGLGVGVGRGAYAFYDRLCFLTTLCSG